LSEPPGEPGEPTPGTYHRESRGLEFDRVSFFTDAVYAIAMTLLVVDLRVGRGAGPLVAVLDDMNYEIFGFFLGFLIIGRFWLAHHRFFGALRSVDLSMVRLNLVYLALVAFCPFPVGLISAYEEDPTAFLLFAVTVAGISLLEVVLLLMAARGGHLARDLSPAGLRYTLAMASSPVVVILLSLPLVAFSTTAALLFWLAMIPVGIAFDRFAPPEVRDPANRPGM
jgi:uncharacterized membrane protein